MASSSKDESSDEDLYGDIDDMYVSQSETESIPKPEDTLISDSQNKPDTSKPWTTSQSDMSDGNADDMNDLDLYDDLIAEEDRQKIESYQEIRFHLRTRQWQGFPHMQMTENTSFYVGVPFLLKGLRNRET
ncbi:uncharacterized protein LOC123552476 [Mercenaria mercenaria]|uniref:uncharacterized protein LOC123552476 n=1 Tax=Mercenaria mercenaria TaxID=6596 RepID=UPI00234F2836|nr:uncharacterized protein LOC123552476 [Mercenaria mercenaria]